MEKPTFKQELKYRIGLAKKHVDRLEKELEGYYPSRVGSYPNPFNGAYSRAAVELEISVVIVHTLEKVLDLFMEGGKR